MNILLLVALLIGLAPSVAHTATRWVSPSGGAGSCAAVTGDNDPGSYMTPAALASNGCAVGGDTVMYKSGTYTGPATRLDLILPSGTSPTNVSRHLCEGNRTCTIAWNSVAVSQHGLFSAWNVNHYLVGLLGNGFIVDAVNTNSVDHAQGIHFHISSGGVYSNIHIEGNLVRNTRSSGVGFYENQPAQFYQDVKIRHNKFEPIIVDFGSPHPIYVKGNNFVVEYNHVEVQNQSNSYAIQGWHLAGNMITRYNYFKVAPLARGYAGSNNETGLPTNNQIYGNIFDCPTANCTIGIHLHSGADNTSVYNNTVYGFSTFVLVSSGNTGSTFKNNLCAGAACGITQTSPIDCGGTCSAVNPTVTAASHFKDHGNADFSLIAGSSQIDAGVDVGLPFRGAAPDRGAFETFAASSASITSSAINVTLNPAYSPITLGGTTGWSATCSGTGCPGGGTLTIVSVARSGNTIASVQVSGFSGGACAVGQTIQVSFNPTTGVLTDGIAVGAGLGTGSKNQPVTAFTNLAVANQCSGTPPPGPVVSTIVYELDGDAQDTSGGAFHGTLSGGATFGDGLYGQALQGVASTAVSVTAPYGNAENPTTQSITLAFGYLVPDGAENSTAAIAGTATGTNQRMYVGPNTGTWQIGIQASPYSAATPSNKPVTPGWHRLCLVMNSSTNVASLYVDGQLGPTKSYTSYTLASDIAFGLPSGFSAANSGAGRWDRAQIWTSVQDCATDYAAWVPEVSPGDGQVDQVSWKARSLTSATMRGGSLPVKVVPSGAVGLAIQVDCTNATTTCASIGLKPWYNKNGGDFFELSNTPSGDGLSFFGITAPLYVGTTALISGALSNGGSTTQRVSTDTTVLDLADDSSHVVTVLLKLNEASVSEDDTFCIKLRDQNGAELNSYTPSTGACLIVGRTQMAN